MQIRMDKFLADAGFGTRSEVKKKLKTETVMVDGVRIRDAAFRFDPEKQQVTVNGKAVSFQLLSYYMLNKPKGVVSATKDPMEKTVVDLVPDGRRRDLFPVGRLDNDTTGLLLFTTNGEVGNEMLHPSHHVWKHYVALVRGVPTQAELDRLREGVELGDGVSAPAEARLFSDAEAASEPVVAEGMPYGHSVVGLSIHEGKKHQVKRMLKAIGHEVVRLHRDEFGPLALSGLMPGEWRELSAAERAAVEEIAQGAGGTAAAPTKEESHG